MSNSLNLITDSASTNFEGFKFVTESFDGNKPEIYTIRGLYCVADAVNGNHRRYPYETLKREVDDFREKMINTGRALAALEHPDHPNIVPDESCARILSLTEDNKSWVGESVVLASQPKFGIRGTPKGDLLLSLLQYGTKVGFSTRCLGNVNEDGVVTDLKMCTIDCVLDPSIQNFCESNGNRFVNGILESKQWVCDNHGDFVEQKFDLLESKLNKLPNTNISSKKADYIGKALTEFLDSIVK